MIESGWPDRGLPEWGRAGYRTYLEPKRRRAPSLRCSSTGPQRFLHRLPHEAVTPDPDVAVSPHFGAVVPPYRKPAKYL